MKNRTAQEAIRLAVEDCKRHGQETGTNEDFLTTIEDVCDLFVKCGNRRPEFLREFEAAFSELRDKWEEEPEEYHDVFGTDFENCD